MSFNAIINENDDIAVRKSSSDGMSFSSELILFQSRSFDTLEYYDYFFWK